MNCELDGISDRPSHITCTVLGSFKALDSHMVYARIPRAVHELKITIA